MFRNSFVVLDLETGGLIGKGWVPPITEIAICVMDSELKDTVEYESLLKQYRDSKEYQPIALSVSNITLDMLKEQGKDPKVVLKEVKDLLIKSKSDGKKPILVGHNLDEFDLIILDNFFTENGEDLSKYVETKMTIDTMWWMRLMKPSQVNFKLGTCLEEVKIDLTQAHRAMNDTRATKELARIFIRNLRGESFRETLETRFRKVFKFQF